MIIHSRVYVILFAGIILNTSAYSQAFDENFKLPKYQLSGNGTSFTVKSGSHKVIRMDHRSVSNVVESDKNFNHAVRRGNTIIATGDVPTFAMLRILLNNKLDPDILRLGDGRIGIRYKGKTEWLDEAASVQTLFNPGNTEYNIQSVVFPDLKFKIAISQAYDWGMIVKVVVMNKTIDPADLQITFSYGRSGTINRTFSANYFNFSDNVKDNEVLIENNIAVLHQKGQDFRAAATTWPAVHPRIIDSIANFTIAMKVNANKSDSVYFIAAQSDNETGTVHSAKISSPT